MKIYVGNLSFDVTDESLSTLFEGHGSVMSAKVIMDRDTGRSKGFGFVEMNDGDGQKAIDALNETDFQGRQIRVNEARPQKTGGGGRSGGGGHY